MTPEDPQIVFSPLITQLSSVSLTQAHQVPMLTILSKSATFLLSNHSNFTGHYRGPYWLIRPNSKFLMASLVRGNRNNSKNLFLWHLIIIMPKPKPKPAPCAGRTLLPRMGTEIWISEILSAGILPCLKGDSHTYMSELPHPRASLTKASTVHDRPHLPALPRARA